MSKQKAAKSVTNGQMADRVGFEPTGVARPGRWLTTAYDDMVISREKGARREVRRMLASRSRTLLERYRRYSGEISRNCPLQEALSA